MTRNKHAKVFLDLKLGSEQVVAGDARKASATEIVNHALQRLAELRKQRRQEAEQGKG